MRFWSVFVVVVLSVRTVVCGAELPASTVPAPAWGQVAGGEEATAMSAGLPVSTADAALSVAIAREDDRVKVVFQGALQRADAVSGPWLDVTNAVSPFYENFAGGKKFYRTREPGVQSIFSSRTVVDWTTTGPFQLYFDKAYAGVPDGIFPPHRDKSYFDARLKMGSLDLPMTMKVRGNSSLQECPFPKLKLKISKDQRAGTPFSDAREIKIGTHCAEGGDGNIGRLRDERTAFREALAYETMELMGFIGPRVRRARIEYHDTTPTNQTTEAGWTVTRNAVILDDIEVVAERLGGRALSDEEVAALTKAGFDEQLIADLQFFHALLGNWDYRLSVDGQNLWNTEVVALPGGTLAPVAGDFDLASWVTGTARVSAPREYHPELADIERQARYEMEQIRQRVTAERFAAASTRFEQKRVAMESLIAQVQIDDEGRTNALRHVAAFFDALGAVGK